MRIRPLDVADLRCCRCGARAATAEQLLDPDAVDRIAHEASRGLNHLCVDCGADIRALVLRLRAQGDDADRAP